jgi:dUTP pyrophosphatase
MSNILFGEYSLKYDRILSMKIKIKKLNEDAKIPSYAHFDDAGMDMYAVADTLIKAGDRAQVPTGIAMKIPEGHVGLIWDKSGLSHKYGLKTLGGVIDSGYRGEILVGIINLGKEDYLFEKGHKVAQMIIQEKVSVEFDEVLELDETSERGVGGIGSTGK